MYTPRYSKLLRSGELAARADEAVARLSECKLCPRKCGVNRLKDEIGTCRTGRHAQMASFGPHFGEEQPLVGNRGSGTIFFTGCNLNCTFCQNAELSQGGGGMEVDAHTLAHMFADIQRRGCHNLNLVTPTHVLPQILEALVIAAGDGLALPLVWNCGGYESIDALSLLDGVVDIYMPDFKFTDEDPSRAYCDAPDYPFVVKEAIAEMHRQVGDLQMDDTDLATTGLLVRHLVMPNELAGSEAAIRFLFEKISPHTYVNIMNQYRPCHLAKGDPDIGHFPQHDLWMDAIGLARKLGLRVDG